MVSSATLQQQVRDRIVEIRRAMKKGQLRPTTQALLEKLILSHQKQRETLTIQTVYQTTLNTSRVDLVNAADIVMVELNDANHDLAREKAVLYKAVRDAQDLIEGIPDLPPAPPGV